MRHPTSSRGDRVTGDGTCRPCASTEDLPPMEINRGPPKKADHGHEKGAWPSRAASEKHSQARTSHVPVHLHPERMQLVATETEGNDEHHG